MESGSGNSPASETGNEVVNKDLEDYSNKIISNEEERIEAENQPQRPVSNMSDLMREIANASKN